MGKASRRKGARTAATATAPAGTAPSRAPKPAPFVRRPFEGLPGETDWVAMYEILPAATATVTLKDPAAVGPGAPEQATIATVLPLAWPGLHRADGTVFAATQAGGSSGDASRDLARTILAVAATEPGTPVPSVTSANANTPRLQDLLDLTVPLEVTVHPGFDFWVEGQDLDAEAQASLERANESVVPTVAMSGTPSAYWVRIGDRTHIRLVLGDDEDGATDALARLLAAGDAGLGGETRLLGAFRTCGLLVPVWDLDPAEESGAYEEPLAAFMTRYAAALADGSPLDAEERRARSGLLSRQVTLR